MRNLIITIVLLLSFVAVVHTQALEHIPFKLKSQKISIKTNYGQEFNQNYLVDANDKGVFIVNDKSMIKKALQEDCGICTYIPHKDISRFSLKGGVSNTAVIAGTLLGAGVIWVLAGGTEEADGLSDRERRGIFFLLRGVPIAVLTAWVIGHVELKDANNKLRQLKIKSTKYKFYRKCGESVRKFNRSWRLNKSYKLYVGPSFKLMEGKIIARDMNKIQLMLIDDNEILEVDLESIKCVR